MSQNLFVFLRVFMYYYYIIRPVIAYLHLFYYVSNKRYLVIFFPFIIFFFLISLIGRILRVHIKNIRNSYTSRRSFTHHKYVVICITKHRHMLRSIHYQFHRRHDHTKSFDWYHRCRAKHPWVNQYRFVDYSYQNNVHWRGS